MQQLFTKEQLRYNIICSNHEHRVNNVK